MIAHFLFLLISQIVTFQIPFTPSKLIHKQDLIYQRSIHLPQEQIGTSSFSYGGTALAFNPSNNSLFLVGHPYQQKVAEISMTDPATILQPFTDITEGRLPLIGLNPTSDSQIIGGLLVYKNQLYLSAYLYYDGNASQILSHFVSGTKLTTNGDVGGPYQIGSYNIVPGQNTAGFVDGWMVLVPSNWSALLGPVLMGQCCLPIISRTSLGPAIFTLDPEKIGKTNPVPTTPLLYYTGEHPLSSNLANVTTQMGGAVFLNNTDSLLFFGRIGLGKYCYGEGTADKSLEGTGPVDDPFCYDPAEGSKGPHMFPYVYFVWAYDAKDLLKVKNGAMNPWDVRPYDTWQFDLPSKVADAIISGVTYDPIKNLIFISQYHGDGDRPMIHVFKVVS